MKRGMLGFAPAVLALVAALAVAAWAQGDKGATKDSAPGGAAAGTPPAASNGALHTVSSPTLGLSIDLPSGGTLLTPESANWPWATVPEMAYHWMGGGGVKEVLVHVYTFASPVTQPSFKDFTKALLDDFTAMDKADAEKAAKDKTSQAKQALGIEKHMPHFKLGDDQGKINATWDDGSNVWNHLAVKDLRNPKQAVNYSILSTFYGNKIYTVTLIYLSDYGPQVKNFAQSIMSSLHVDGAIGPLGVEQLGLDTSSTMPPGTAAPSSSAIPPAGSAAKPTAGSVKPGAGGAKPGSGTTPAPRPAGH